MPETRRRLPRYSAFLVSGAAVGLVAALVLALGPGSAVDDRTRLIAYLGALLGGIGALLGGLVAVLIDARRG